MLTVVGGDEAVPSVAEACARGVHELGVVARQMQMQRAQVQQRL